MTRNDSACDAILVGLEHYYDAESNRVDIDSHVNSCPECQARLEQIRERLRDLACRDVVELVTDYLESSLEPDLRIRFDDHIRLCQGCRDYLEQMRRCLELLGRVGRESGASDRKGAISARLLEAYRARYPAG